MSRLHAVLVLGLAAGLVGAACGGAPGATAVAAGGVSGMGPESAEVDASSPSSGTESPAPSSTASASPSPSSSSSSGSAATPGSLAPTEMKSPIASAVGADLVALGLDPKNLPPIEKLEPRALRGVMKIMARSVGLRCTDCHLYGDFAAPTPRKRIAAHMWNEFAAGLTLADGSPVFCDSCHQGHTKLLDRSDKKALGRWMQAAFVDGVKRKDGQPEKCESCHVSWNMTFLATWAAR